MTVEKTEFFFILILILHRGHQDPRKEMPIRTQICMNAVCGVECPDLKCKFAHNWLEAEQNFYAFCEARGDMATYVILAREHEDCVVYGGRLSWDKKFFTITFPGYKAYVNHVLAPKWIEKFESGWAVKWAEREMEFIDAKDVDDEAKKNMEVFEALMKLFADAKKEIEGENEGAEEDEDDEAEAEAELMTDPTFVPREMIVA